MIPQEREKNAATRINSAAMQIINVLCETRNRKDLAKTQGGRPDTRTPATPRGGPDDLNTSRVVLGGAARL
jgi:hypothetical protein